MKILVTGGAGYIGTTLVPMLLKKKYSVTVVDSLLYGGAQLIPFLSNPDFTFVKGDIRDKKLIARLCQKQDVIIHLAAIVGFPACRENPDLAISTNVGGTKNIADSVNKKQLVLFGSTGSNYGKLENEICTEKTPLNPQSLYGKTKTQAELYLREHTTCIAYRFATAFGLSPRLRLDLLINELVYLGAKQKYLVVYEADFVRSFIHVSDMARSFLFAIEHYKQMKNQVYNIGSEKLNYTKREVAEIVKKETNAYVHYADYDNDVEKRNYHVSYEKVRKLGFKTKVSIESGIHELVTGMDLIHISNPYINS